MSPFRPLELRARRLLVVAATALIAFAVSVVNAHVLDRWWRY
jgi:hypothetical protein